MNTTGSPSTPPLPIRDIHQAPQPEWWPPAPGWWVLAVLLLVALIILSVVLLIRYRRHKRYLRVRKELTVLEQQWKSDGDSGGLIRGVSKLLRRIVLYASDDPALATMNGQRWADFLASVLPDDSAVSLAAVDVATQVYSNEPETDCPEDIIRLADVWMQHAYTGKPKRVIAEGAPA